MLAMAVQLKASSAASALMFAGSFGPSLAAVVMVAKHGGRIGLRAWFVRCVQWPVLWKRDPKLGLSWLAFALLLPAVLSTLAAGLHVALGGHIGTSPAQGHGLMTFVNFFLILLIGGPLGEEFGWRGFALPRLQEGRDWRAASLWLGLIWGLWHLPLFFIPGSSQAHIPLLSFLLSVLAMSVLFAWLVNRCEGSVVIALLLHTAINFWPSIIPVLPTSEGHRPYDFLVAMLVVLALPLLMLPKAASPEWSTRK